MVISELLKRVRVVMNESADDSDVSLLSLDTRRLDDSIKELLPRAVSFVQDNKGATAGRVNTKSLPLSSTIVADNSSGGGLMELPEDFVEIVSLQLEGWQSPVCRLHSHNSSEAAWQRNAYTRAGVNRPVCIETFSPTGARCALLFPYQGDSGSKLHHFVYEAAFNPVEGLKGYDKGMEDAVVYACASLLYTVFERYDAANAMLTQALAACGGQLGKQ